MGEAPAEPGQMDTLDARALRYFLAVARFGSIRGAAEHCRTAASAISRQIADMEASLNLPLFERSPRGVAMTEAGLLVLEHAKRVVEDHGLLVEQLDHLKGVQQTRVRLLCGEGFIADLIDNGIRQFAAIYPRILFTLRAASSEAIIDGVTNGDADIGIVYNPVIDPRIRSLAIARQPLCAVIPPDHRLGGRARAALAEFAGTPCALLTEGHGVRQLVGRVAADAGIALVPLLETVSIDALRRFVVAGLGVTFLPRFAVSAEEARGAVALVELTDPLLAEATAHLVVRAHRRLPASVDRLASHIARSMVAFGG